MMQILCSPDTNDVEEYIAEQLIPQKKKILHIVPTLILFRKRLKFYRDKFFRFWQKNKREQATIVQRKLSQEKDIHLYEMDQFLQDQIYQFGKLKGLPLTRQETSILVERILADRHETNNIAWKSAIPDLTSAFFEFSQAQLSPQILKEFEKNPSWQLVCDIYEVYLNKLKALNTWDYGQACVAAIERISPDDYDLLILDGAFLPIKAKHHQLIEKFQSLNKPIYCFIPYDLEVTNPAHTVLEKTYRAYLPLSQWKSIKGKDRLKHQVVEKLAEQIFHGQLDQIDDRSIEMFKFHHVEEEMERIVEKAANYIKLGHATAQQIAIITPDPMEMRPMVRELAELYNLETETPERPLAQLAQGRAIHTLYAIHSDERIGRLNLASHYVDSQMIMDLLDSGLLKGFDELRQSFHKMEAFFEDVNTFTQWYEIIDGLSEAKTKIDEKYHYHPLYQIPQKRLDELKTYIQIVEDLSRSLINTPDQTFTHHLQHMYNILNHHPMINEPNKEIEERLLRLEETLSLNEQIPITPLEFADRIKSVLMDNNYEEPIETDTVKLLVTGPNNVEYQKYDYIFLSRFTQNRYPQPVKWKWPLNEKIEFEMLSRSTRLSLKNPGDLIRYYLDRSMYYVYISILATGKKLTITYSTFEEGSPQYPSHYMYDIADVFNITLDQAMDQPVDQLLIEKDLLLLGSKQKKTQVEPGGNWTPAKTIQPNERVTIEEVAIFDYCPRRFYYEKAYPAERTYTDIFHIQHYATACLYEVAVHRLIDHFPTLSIQTKDYVLISLPEIVAQASELIRPLFPIPHRYWEDVESRASFHIKSLINQILKDSNHREAHLSISKQQNELTVQNLTFYGERQLKIQHSDINHTRYYSITNLKTLLSFFAQTHDKESQEKLTEIQRNYFNLLSKLCINRLTDMQKNKLEEMAQQIINQQFPKQAGPHCQYCVFQYACKEKEIVRHGQID